MDAFLYNRGKDAAPEETVARIFDCLSGIGLRAVCRFLPSPEDVPDCETCIVELEPPIPGVSATGKGATREFCMASGYAEFMERLQNRMLGCKWMTREDFPGNCLPKEPQDEVHKMSFREVVAGKDPYLYAVLCALAGDSAGILSSTQPMRASSQLLAESFYRTMSAYPAEPFYAVHGKKTVYLTTMVAKSLSGSNGMAAGNTLEEALVQGFCEIFERAATREILEQNLTPPRLPRSRLRDYPSLEARIKMVEAAGPYRVQLLDFSLGKGFPVVGLCVVNQKTQTCGLNVGAHPDFGIALERTLTEAMQGKSLSRFAASMKIAEGFRQSAESLYNRDSTGTGILSHTFFSNTPSWPLSEWAWDGKQENGALAKALARKILSEGYEIYAQDVSYLGFPAVYLLVPGLSDRGNYRLILNLERLRAAAYEALTQQNPLRESGIRMLLAYAEEACRLQEFSARSFFLQREITPPIPGHNDMGFAAALCCCALGEYRQAEVRLRRLSDPEWSDYFQTAARYMRLKALGEPIDCLFALVGAETVRAVLDDFEQPALTLQRVFPMGKNGPQEDAVFALHERLMQQKRKNFPGTEALEKCLTFHSDEDKNR